VKYSEIDFGFDLDEMNQGGGGFNVHLGGDAKGKLPKTPVSPPKAGAQISSKPKGTFGGEISSSVKSPKIHKGAGGSLDEIDLSIDDLMFDLQDKEGKEAQGDAQISGSGKVGLNAKIGGGASPGKFGLNIGFGSKTDM